MAALLPNLAAGFCGRPSALKGAFSEKDIVENNQGVAKMGNSSVCHTTTEPSGLVQMSEVSVKYNLYLY